MLERTQQSCWNCEFISVDKFEDYSPTLLKNRIIIQSWCSQLGCRETEFVYEPFTREKIREAGKKIRKKLEEKVCNLWKLTKLQ